MNSETDLLQCKITAYKARDEHAFELINKAIELMDSEQVGQWSGVRLWLETTVDDYPLEFEEEVKDE